MDSFSLNQLVLAKLRGYPWWPALVRKVEYEDDSETLAKIRVDFIGENTHAFLPPDKVQPYSKWKKLCTTKQKSLLRALELAKAFDQGRFTPDQLVEVNKNPVLELARAKKPSRTHVAPPTKQRKLERNVVPESSEEEVEEVEEVEAQSASEKDQSEHSSPESTDPSQELATLNTQLDRIIGESLITGSSLPSSNPLTAIRKMQKTISGFTHIYSPDAEAGRNVTKSDLSSLFKHLIQLNVNSTILRSCNILKAVKLFSQEFIGHADEELNALGCLAHKLQLYWKKMKVEEDLAAISTVGTEAGNLPTSGLAMSLPISAVQSDDLDVQDLDLKKRSWKKLLRILEAKGVSKKTAKGMATVLERAQRKKDPSMRSDYRRLVSNAVKELQKTDSAGVEKTLQRLL